MGLTIIINIIIMQIVANHFISLLPSKCTLFYSHFVVCSVPLYEFYVMFHILDVDFKKV